MAVRSIRLIFYFLYLLTLFPRSDNREWLATASTKFIICTASVLCWQIKCDVARHHSYYAALPLSLVTCKLISEVKDYFQKCFVSLLLEEKVTAKMHYQFAPYRSPGLMTKPKEI